MVSHSKSNKFYKRQNTGKYLLDVYELNQEFLNRDQMKDRFDDFHNKRVQLLLDREIIPSIDTSHFFLLSAFPINSSNINIDLADYQTTRSLSSLLKPIRSNSWNYQHNLEGYYIFETNSHYNDFSYNQFFRDMSLEFFTSTLHWENDREENRLDLLGFNTEKAIDTCLNSIIDVYKYFGAEPIFYLKLSIIGLIDSYIINENDPFRSGGLINRKNIKLPGFLFNSDNTEEMKLQIKDTIWQCGGIPQSLARINSLKS